MDSNSIRKGLDLVFQVVPVLFGCIWTGQAVHAILTQKWNIGVPLWFIYDYTIRIHATTVVLVCTFYIYTFYNLNYLWTDIRVPVSMALTANGFIFYDVAWAILDYSIAGIGKPWVNICLFIAVWIILLLYNRKHRFLRGSFLFNCLFVFFIFLMLMLGASGFFQAFHNWPITKVDPHNWLWFTGKVTGVWMWSQIYLKRGGLA